MSLLRHRRPQPGRRTPRVPAIAPVTSTRTPMLRREVLDLLQSCFVQTQNPLGAVGALSESAGTGLAGATVQTTTSLAA